MTILTLTFSTCFLEGFAWRNDEILHFHSDILVGDDGTVTVKETLVVDCHGWDVKHGLIREIPTTRRNFWGDTEQTPIKVIDVEIDGRPSLYSVRRKSDRTEIRMGSTGRRLPVGKHTFTLEYSSERVILFRSKQDKLSLNITGHEWSMPILKATASIEFPEGVSADQLQVTGYTGRYGSTSNDLKIESHGNRVLIENTLPLNLRQGITIAVDFPTGVVAPPTAMKQFVWFLDDHRYIFVLGTGLALLAAIGLHISKKSTYFYRQPQAITETDRPPKNMSPGAVAFLLSRSTASGLTTALVAEVIQLGVNGLIEITSTEESWPLKRTKFTLRRTRKEAQDPYAREFLDLLFEDGTTLKLDRRQLLRVIKLRQKLKAIYKKDEKQFINNRLSLRLFSLTTSLLSLIFFLLAVPFDSNWLPLGSGAIVIASILVWIITPCYTSRGLSVRKEIDRYKRYLLRRKEEGSLTPALYEKHLPYAIATQIEQKWNDQFHELFKEMVPGHDPHTHFWLYSHLRHRHTSLYSDGLYNAFSNPYTGSGGHSGSGGGGFSGGGSFGGGGRGF